MHRHAVAFTHALVALLLGGANVIAQTPQYTVYDLGTVGDLYAISQNGAVIGTTSSNSGQFLAFRSRPNAAPDLPADYIGTLGGSSSWAQGINSDGQVVGYSTTSSGETHGFRTAPNAAINPATDDLGSLGGPAANGFLTNGRGINDSGQTTGSSVITNGGHGFRTAPNAAINPSTDDIPYGGTDPQTAHASGISINSAGDVLGAAGDANGYFSAFVAFHDGTITTIPQFAWTLDNHVTGINDQGQVAGNVAETLYLWQNGTLTALADCKLCEPYGINNKSQVVGFDPYNEDPPAPFLYTGNFYYLNNLIPSGSGWVLRTAIAINDQGQIIGSGTLNGAVHLFRLDPVPTTLSLSPAYLTFAPQAVGTTSSAQFVTVTNNGSSPLTFTGDTVSGDFALAGVGTCGTSLAAGASCTISIHFTPTATGTRTGVLTIPDNAPNSPQTVSLIGTGGQSGPVVSLSPASLTFAAQAVGTTSSAQFVTVTNIGSATLTFTGDTVTGDFALAGLGTCGTSLAPGANCTISIHFTPTAAGTRTGFLVIPDNASNSPQTVNLTGTGSGPALSLSPTSLTFAPQTVGTTSSAQFVTVTNTGSETLTFTGDMVSGDFALAGLGTCGTSLAPGANCTISIHFTPTATGTRTGVLTIPDNAPDNPQTVPLSGTGQ